MDDSCTTDDQRKSKNLPTKLFQLPISSYVLRNLHLRTTCDNNALVLVDQVGLWICLTMIMLFKHRYATIVAMQRQQHLRRLLCFMMKTWTMCWTQAKSVRGSSPRSPAQLCQTSCATTRRHDEAADQRRTAVDGAR